MGGFLENFLGITNCQRLYRACAQRLAFLLTVLMWGKPTTDGWFSREPLGHNYLSKIVQGMCSRVGIPGYCTNHSLQAKSAARLFCAGVDEQLIMEHAAG